MEGDCTTSQDEYKSGSRVVIEQPEGQEETTQPGKQQHGSVGLEGSDQSSKMNGPDLNPGMNSADFSNMMPLDPSFNHGMDYNPMMQFMSGNMGSGMANFNPLLGKS